MKKKFSYKIFDYRTDLSNWVNSSMPDNYEIVSISERNDNVTLWFYIKEINEGKRELGEKI